MPHINHRRGETRRGVHRYPYDLRSRKVPDFSYFRCLERAAMQRLRAGDDPESIVWPTMGRENDNPWNWD